MLLQTFINNRLINSTEDMKIIRKTAIAPFSFCNQAMNDFRINTAPRIGIIKRSLIKGNSRRSNNETFADNSSDLGFNFS